MKDSLFNWSQDYFRIDANDVLCVLQDSDDEDGDEGEDAEEGVPLKMPSPVHEEQSEPEMTDEEREFQLVSATHTCTG